MESDTFDKAGGLKSCRPLKAARVDLMYLKIDLKPAKCQRDAWRSQESRPESYCIEYPAIHVIRLSTKAALKRGTLGALSVSPALFQVSTMGSA